MQQPSVRFKCEGWLVEKAVRRSHSERKFLDKARSDGFPGAVSSVVAVEAGFVELEEDQILATDSLDEITRLMTTLFFSVTYPASVPRRCRAVAAAQLQVWVLAGEALARSPLRSG